MEIFETIQQCACCSWTKNNNREGLLKGKLQQHKKSSIGKGHVMQHCRKTFRSAGETAFSVSNWNESTKIWEKLNKRQNKTNKKGGVRRGGALCAPNHAESSKAKSEKDLGSGEVARWATWAWPQPSKPNPSPPKKEQREKKKTKPKLGRGRWGGPSEPPVVLNIPSPGTKPSKSKYWQIQEGIAL